MKSKGLIVASVVVGLLILTVGVVFYNMTKEKGLETVPQQEQPQEPQVDQSQNPQQQQVAPQPQDQSIVNGGNDVGVDNGQVQAQGQQGQIIDQQTQQAQQEQTQVQQQTGGSPATNLDGQPVAPVTDGTQQTTQTVTPQQNTGVQPTQNVNTQSLQQVEPIERNKLGVSTSTKTVEMALMDKRLYKTSALDADLQLSQTAYVAVISDGTLTLPIFITASTFNALTVGDKLKVTYSTFNNNGEDIYDVYKVEK